MAQAFRSRATGAYPVTADMIRQAHKATVSFGPMITPDVADALGYDVVLVDPPPEYDTATHELVAVDPQIIGGQWVQGWTMQAIPASVVASRSQALRTGLVTQIDEAVAAIYGRFTRFAIEYQEREAQAQAFKDAGYTGPVPPRVAEFATPAGMPAQAATDLILAQAASLRTAQATLSALRMRKYEVLRAATDAQAQASADTILQSIAAVGAQVS
jgi:hypothetical protein